MRKRPRTYPIECRVSESHRFLGLRYRLTHCAVSIGTGDPPHTPSIAFTSVVSRLRFRFSRLRCLIIGLLIPGSSIFYRSYRDEEPRSDIGVPVSVGNIRLPKWETPLNLSDSGFPSAFRPVIPGVALFLLVYIRTGNPLATPEFALPSEVSGFERREN